MSRSKTPLVEQAVKEALKETRGQTLAAAVSGGADSMALLTALVRLREEEAWTVLCVHVQHNLRGEESRRDQEAVAALCARFSVPCFVAVVPPGEIERRAKIDGRGIEAAAREERHTRLRETARRHGAARLLIAHSRDDLLETILIRLLRGAGPAGLAPLRKKNGLITRPLLALRRADLIEYLDEQGVAYRVDSSNLSGRFLRSRLRLRLIPVLRDFFPGWEQNLERMAETQRLLARYLRSRVKKALLRAAADAEDGITLRDFFSFPEIIREEMLFSTINRLRRRARAGTNDDLTADETSFRPVPPPRRAALRKFSRTGRGATLGGAQTHARGNDALVSCGDGAEDYGFSLVIDGEGVYRLQKMTVICTRGEDGALRLVVRGRG
jgi:tRNA(Ile)-lysidine synthase